MDRGLRLSAPDFEWRDPVGMRNWLIHGYDVVDLDVVWDTVTTDIPKLKAVVVGLLASGPASPEIEATVPPGADRRD